MRVVLPYLKAWAALVGAVATALLGIYTTNETLTVVAAVATAVTTWSVPNTPRRPATTRAAELESSLPPPLIPGQLPQSEMGGTLS